MIPTQMNIRHRVSYCNERLTFEFNDIKSLYTKNDFERIRTDILWILLVYLVISLVTS